MMLFVLSGLTYLMSHRPNISSIYTKQPSHRVLISNFLTIFVYRARQYMSQEMHKKTKKRHKEGLKAASQASGY